MRTGNGRHRRPRQAPALFVTAGVTGAGIALPLLGAGGAHAADVSTWDRVAQCESGGEWSADPGDGHYGGLSLTKELWRDFGGTTYAPRPDLASRSQQITVAEAILAAQGADTWTTCARDAHLERGTGPADVDPGLPLPSRAPAATDPTGSDPSAPSASHGTSADREDATDEPAADDSAAGDSTAGDDSTADEPSGSGQDAEADATSPAPTPSATHGDGHGSAEAPSGDGATTSAGDAAGDRQGAKAGRHRGTPDPSEGNGEVTEPARGEGGAAASRGGADGRGPQSDGSYTVRPGDNLSVIADAHRVDGGWQGLYDANRSVVGADPDLILPGQQLRFDR